MDKTVILEILGQVFPRQISRILHSDTLILLELLNCIFPDDSGFQPRIAAYESSLLVSN